MCGFLLVQSGPASAGRILEVDADRQFDFAGHLFDKADYDRAVTEYERFIFLFPDNDRVVDAMYQIGTAYFRSGRYPDAVEAFSRIADRHGTRPISESDTVLRAYYRISECYVRMGATGQAVNTLNNLAALTDSHQIRDEVRYRMGWVLLEAGLWKNAALAFNEIDTERQERYGLPELFDAMGEYQNISRKKPGFAGALAVIPGLGYLYCERYRDALVSFFLNSGMMLATYTAFRNDNPALGGLLALVESGFYSGNIYGSITSAHKYNQDQTERFISDIRTRYKLDLSLSPTRGGALLSLRYSF
ncbi:Tetratricopeptide repeat-containing protein [Desulfococcus multivorans DSM 2059]|jgi:tetratricopeptide (TPR) repeat protein|uniref:Tetratricopeptide repeat-containing protein n=2 Tax=Desulfococcaceae TaxID=2931039 RepID=S7TQ06_DESML|nr:Tetratricopeptide repeat-containing protein [Desulfococcus multivorans DSM 2059]SJZ64276.1 Tetratricopeptide repeat-containing protein [Desulfococcus multivorans DSM 2059]